jgi:hypothetical protein
MPFGKKPAATAGAKEFNWDSAKRAPGWTYKDEKGFPVHVHPGPILTKPVMHACAHFMPDRLPEKPDVQELKKLGFMMIAAKRFLHEMEGLGLGSLDKAMMPQCCLESIADDPKIRGIIHIGAHIGQEAKW